MAGFANVMGFEFDNEVVKEIRECDISLRLLVSLQENGVALVDGDMYNGTALDRNDSEYWTEYKNYRGDVALISDDFKQVFTG